MGLSQRQYAAHRGVSHTAVAKALATGRISAEPDGSIDPVKADRAVGRRDRSGQAARRPCPAARGEDRARHRRGEGRLGTKPVPQAAIKAVNETLSEAGTDAPADAEGGQVSFLRARMANEVIKAQTAKVRLQKMKGDLVDRNRAVAAVFDLARRERDSWLNLPPRVAANMAAELGVEAHRMEQVLDRVLRAHLAEMAEVKLELR